MRFAVSPVDSSPTHSPVDSTPTRSADDVELIGRFLNAVAAAKGITTEEAQQRVLLDAARQWQAATIASLKSEQHRKVSNAAPISPTSLTILLIITGVLAIVAGAIFVLTE